MNQNFRSSALALAVAIGWALPAHGQSADADAIRQELAAMRAQMEQMAERIDTLESQLATAQAKADAAEAAAGKAVAAAAQTATAKPNTEITWDGAPKLSGKGGWSFKPRGRLQIDTAGVDGPSGIVARKSLGIGTEFRRAYIGFDGTIPGGFGYRVEADLANSGVELTDLYLTYKATPEITVTAGQHKPFQSLEDMTSDLFTSFMERAAFNSAFGFERRIGLSATYTGKVLLVQGGVFADNAADLNTDTNNSRSFDGRIVFMPKLGGGQLHIGGSAHFRELNDLANVGRYRARPFVHTTDLRLVDTGNVIPVSGERGFGAEAAYIHGRFHATAESHWLTAKRPGLPDPTFNGGYAEVGYLLTDDVTAYKGGTYDRIRPKNPLGNGGLGALQINARYDWLDLSDAGIVGGRQQVAGLSLLWIPADYVRFIVNYGHLWIKDAAVPASGDRNYSVDALGMRAQVDF
jgi:phosphate-selective porin OprO/OprP